MLASVIFWAMLGLVLVRRCFLPFILLLASLARPETASAIATATDWYARAWQTDNGLPSANVTGVAQTRDGFLWLATQSGFARFDGFKVDEVLVPLGHLHPIIRAMVCDHAERFWLGEDFGVVVRMGVGGSQPALFSPANGLSDSTPQQLVETGDHAVWIAYGDGTLCRIASNSVVTRFGLARISASSARRNAPPRHCEICSA